VHRINLTLVRLNGEAKNLEYEIDRSKALIDEIGKTISDRSNEIEKAEKEIVSLESETEATEKTLAEDYTRKETQEKEVELKLASYETLKEELLKREREIRAVRKDRDEVADRVHALEMEIAELEHQAKSLKERIKEAYGKDLGKIKPEEDLDVAEAEVKIDELRRKMKGLGLVNMMALEEYETEKKRLDFLNEQRTDLLSAEETLKETILKINITARERFSEVFDKVRTNFQETFTRFFQGGEADLRLPEDEDPLEAQIEIIARPAGKHFRDLDLLSGGERALTAISLLFALYLVKPSPFCILDEIDAPLDDANVQRFTRVLNEFAEKTQFVIVTHNKMTMKVAQALYGVTMEQEGVSKIVSVRFGEEEVVEAA
jgi:chromosome segregation protein